MLISGRLGFGEKVFPELPGLVGDVATKILRPLFRSFQSTLLFGFKACASPWKNTETPNREYTANDYESLF